jgi:hypothetical protein
MDEDNQKARDFVPGVDTLIVLYPLKHGEAELQPGDVLPQEDFDEDRLRCLIRVAKVRVKKGDKAVLAKVKPAAKVAVETPAKVEIDTEKFKCDVCGRDDFAKKVNLGAHMRSHKKK